MEDVASFSWVLFHTFILVFHFFQPCKRGNTYFWLFQMNKLRLRRGWQGNLEPQSQKAAKHSSECRSDPESPRSFPGVTEGEVGGWSTERLSFQKRWDLTRQAGAGRTGAVLASQGIASTPFCGAEIPLRN